MSNVGESDEFFEERDGTKTKSRVSFRTSQYSSPQTDALHILYGQKCSEVGTLDKFCCDDSRPGETIGNDSHGPSNILGISDSQGVGNSVGGGVGSDWGRGALRRPATNPTVSAMVESAFPTTLTNQSITQNRQPLAKTATMIEERVTTSPNLEVDLLMEKAGTIINKNNSIIVNTGRIPLLRHENSQIDMGNNSKNVSLVPAVSYDPPFRHGSPNCLTAEGSPLFGTRKRTSCVGEDSNKVDLTEKSVVLGTTQDIERDCLNIPQPTSIRMLDDKKGVDSSSTRVLRSNSKTTTILLLSNSISPDCIAGTIKKPQDGIENANNIQATPSSYSGPDSSFLSSQYNSPDTNIVPMLVNNESSFSKQTKNL